MVLQDHPPRFSADVHALVSLVLDKRNMVITTTIHCHIFRTRYSAESGWCIHSILATAIFIPQILVIKLIVSFLCLQKYLLFCTNQRHLKYSWNNCIHLRRLFAVVQKVSMFCIAKLNNPSFRFHKFSNPTIIMSVFFFFSLMSFFFLKWYMSLY